jgi:hypothetical protein
MLCRLRTSKLHHEFRTLVAKITASPWFDFSDGPEDLRRDVAFLTTGVDFLTRPAAFLRRIVRIPLAFRIVIGRMELFALGGVVQWKNGHNRLTCRLRKL